MNDDQLLRYSRQIMLPRFDVAGQESLLNAKVLVVGLGGLGCPVALYLAAAGVGELWLADHDTVDLSNLQRQIAHGHADIGRPKVMSAYESIQALNPDCRVQCISEKLTGPLLEDAVAAVDLVADCTDNFSVRFALNRACYLHKKTLVSGAAIRTEGQVAVFRPGQGDSPCYRCLYDDAVQDANLSCSESGVLAPLVGIIGSVQALEVIKCLAHYGQALVGKLLVFDGIDTQWRSLGLPRDPDCPVCGE